MRQLSMSVMIYAGDYDDAFVPATMRTANPADVPTIWTQPLEPYVKNKEIFVAEGSNGSYAANWNERRHQSVGYSDATGYDPGSTAVPGAAPPGTEGFTSAANFSQAEESARVGLFAVTPNGPKGDTTSKHRGYVFNPYNGLNDPGGDYAKGLPMMSDRNLVTDATDTRYPNSPSLLAGRLKPMWGRYQGDGRGAGRTPVVFADGHAKTHSANELNAFGKVIWRFR
jgi:prepilin-type processing-associated H-X9-DG protein